MPSPIDLLLDPISLTVFASYAALIAWETLVPARPLPHVQAWKALGLAAFVVYFFVSSYLPLLWTEHLARFQLFDLSSFGTWGGAIVGLLVYEGGVYVWHRSMHASNVLWRVFHQMHHSAERLDTYGAFWFSPADMLGWTVLSSLCLTLIVGLTPAAATVVLLATTLLAIFQHSNIRTPRWLGYIVQRPESHSRHHARGVHDGNFSDLPIFDLLFNTFHNPPEFVAETGFYQGASRRVAEMFCFRDVSVPPGPPDAAIEVFYVPPSRAIAKRALIVLIAALVLVFASVGAHVVWAKDSPQEHTLPVNGMTMHYQILREGPPLVLLHCFGGYAAMWQPHLDRLSRHYPLIVPDLRDHGRSTDPAGEFTHRQWARDVFALLDHLGIQRFKPKGMSSGGMTLIRMATQQPGQ